MNEEMRDPTLSEMAEGLLDGLATLARQAEPILKELCERVEPLKQSLDAATPLIMAAAHEWERLDIRLRTAERLIEQGWVPNRTTPFDLVAECGEDGDRLQTSLLAYYTDNWREVREQLEARMCWHRIDAESKATFREAFDAHEAGFYRAVSRVLFPEFERVFRKALFDGRAGPVPFNSFVEGLAGETGNLELGDFLFAGIQDLVLFKYLTESVRDPSAVDNASAAGSTNYMPGLGIRVDEKNVDRARQSPIPTRHAVAHGLVVYSSPQSSLNAIFIADYVFSAISQYLRQTSDAKEVEN